MFLRLFGWLNSWTNILQLLVLIFLVHIAGYLVQGYIVDSLKSQISIKEINTRIEQHYKFGNKDESVVPEIASLRVATKIKEEGDSDDKCDGEENILPGTLYLIVTPDFVETRENDESKECRSVEFVRNTMPNSSNLLQSYFLGGIQVVGSWELLARYFEYMFNKPNTRIKLSKFTRAQVESEITASSSSFVRSMIKEKGYLLRAQVFSLFIGPIQYWCIALWLFCMLRSYSIRRELKSSMSSNFTIEDFNTTSDGAGSKIGSDGRGLSPIQLKLYSSVLNRLAGINGDNFSENKATVSQGVLQDITFEKEKYDDQHINLRGIVESIGSLAFIGTISGIIMAMFFLADTKSADLLVSLPANNLLYNSMGVAFGTTLLGLILATVANTYLDGASQKYKTFVNSIYDNVSEFVSKFSQGDEIHQRNITTKRSLFESAVIVVGGVLALILWFVLQVAF